MITIKKRAFDKFVKKFKEGEYGTQRLGQAFYNEFKLDKLSNQTQLNNIYAKDGEHALSSIRIMCNFN
jgi:hypothetical protein